MNVQPQNLQAEAIILNDLSEGVLRLTLNRPKARNALSEAMLAELKSAMEKASEDKDVRCVVLAGNGPAFSAGHDLKEVSARRQDEDRGRAYFKWLMATCSDVMQTVMHSPKPVIAEVAGIASAAGCQLAASCDLVVASENARFCTPGVNIGLFCSTPMVAISRSVSRKHMMEMLLTGDMMDAETAYRFGLVNRVVPDEELRAASDALATTIASKSTAVLAVGKEAFYRQRELPIEDAYAYCSDVMVQNMLFKDAEEGIGAFVEKREPKWEDR
ncbi:MAG: enoyl-CoA hydratase [Pseudomonadota bacterium]